MVGSPEDLLQLQQSGRTLEAQSQEGDPVDLEAMHPVAQPCAAHMIGSIMPGRREGPCTMQCQAQTEGTGQGARHGSHVWPLLG